MKRFLFIGRADGAALIAIVAAILIFSILAAAIVPMVSTSSQQGAVTNLTDKAYLLAESGYRLAASRFLHAGAFEQQQNQALEALDGNYALDANGGSVDLQVFSYFYELSQSVNGETQFIGHAPGNYPGAGALPNDPDDEVELAPNLKLRIGQETYGLSHGSTALDTDRVSFNLDRALSPYPAGTPVYPVADVDLGRNTTISEGGNIAYEPGDARMFPLRNGNIQLNGRTMTYTYNRRNTNELVDVRAPNYPGMVNFDIIADPQMVLTRYVRLHATGIVGSGGMQTRRQVVYYTPLPPSESSAREETYSDRFDATTNWADTSGTFTASQDVGGDNALSVDSAATTGVDQKGALTTFSPVTAAAQRINFGAAQRGTRGYLSYDTQVKVGYEIDASPTQGYYPVVPIPAYVGAGLSFRLGGTADLFSNNGYGISFLRGNNIVVDNIPDDLVPQQEQRTVVLWRQTGNGSQRTWLAYKRLADDLIDENNEDPANNALSEGGGSHNLWDLEPVAIGNPSRQRNDSTRNWYYGIGSSHTYDWQDPPFSGPSVRNWGILESNLVTLPAGSPDITLTFWSWHETEPGRLDTHDLKQIIIVGSPSATYTINSTPAPTIITPPGPDGWYQAQIDLSAYEGQTIRIQFRFDTVDALNNAYEGWYIDDIRLSAQWTPQDVQEATMALRIKEAMVVPFSNGTAQIRQGERIYGARGTMGSVLTTPMIRSGSWGGTPPASGTLLLNRTTVISSGPAFEAGEQLFVMGSTGRAEVTTFDPVNDRKANILQVYLARTHGGGSGSGNNNPLDYHTEPYGRIGIDPVLTELQWPPELDAAGNWTDGDGNWTSGEDYFQLIEWDALNPTASGLSFHAFTSADQGLIEHATIQSHHDDLQTPDYPGIYQQPEVGLHSLGDGAENVFFDDFGIRLIVFASELLPTPIQQ